MTHLVSPTSFRAGKTQTWKWNSILKNNLSTNGVSTKAGIGGILKYKLRRKRLYIVKSTIIPRNNYIKICSLFMPRMKVKPKSDGLGSFSKFVLYKSYNWKLARFSKIVKNYIDERRLKTYKFPHQKKITN